MSEQVIGRPPKRIRLSARMRLFVTVGVIALGLGITAFFGLRAAASFREIQYIRQQGLDRGTASVDAIRPWMTIRFVAVAYAVPEEYLYAQLGVPFDQRNPNASLGRLRIAGGPQEPDAMVAQVRTLVTEYRKNPVTTGLRDVRAWMSIRYIANSSGVSSERILAEVGIPAADNEYQPLGMVADRLHYPGGLKAMIEAIQRALAQPKATP